MSINRRNKLTVLLLILLMSSGIFDFSASANQNRVNESGILTAFSAPQKGCALYIDLDICKMTVYMDAKVLRTFPVSGGKPETPSPLGAWKVSRIESWGQWYGGCFIRLNVPWGTYGIHGTVTPEVIGKYNASGGCIRMHNRDVHELKKMVVPGTLVYLKQNSISFRILENGMIGSDVFYLQQMLNAIGYYKGLLDGKFGNGLEKAVIDFQKNNRINPDGIVGYETFNRIRNSLE